MEQATFGGGCFWCTEAVFQRVRGVEKVVSGYAGGKVKDPSYREVCYGKTGHAEVVQFSYNPEEISYAELVEVFYKTHDPTTLNRQGNDSGTQYRSVIFYHNDEQRKIAEELTSKFDQSGEFSNPIVTEISALPTFYPAEDNHQNYFNENQQQPYCQIIIKPKIDKFLKTSKEKSA
jgi:peptide-methionine (S)-S-oxide reductase